MGQTLSEPITVKESSRGEDKRISYGVSSMQGWRLTMEDAHTTEVNYQNTGVSFFAVFDGHGGSSAAQYSAQNLYKKVLNSESYKKKRFRDALRSGNLDLDDDLREDLKDDPSGCTAIVALLTEDEVLYVSNAGDSRAVISARDGKAIPLSKDHKPNDKIESDRIRNAGNYVEFGRVNGSLALSRALGDFQFKTNTELAPEKQAVSAEPDITEHKLTDHDEFIVLACDGIWDCKTDQEAVDFVRWKLTEKQDLEKICEDLMDECLAQDSGMSGVGCDNMTVIIVAFLRGKTMQEWYDWMANKEVKKPQLQNTAGSGVPIVANNNVDEAVQPPSPASDPSTPSDQGL